VVMVRVHLNIHRLPVCLVHGVDVFGSALAKELSRQYFSCRIKEPCSLLFELKDMEGAVHVIFVLCCLQMLF